MIEQRTAALLETFRAAFAATGDAAAHRFLAAMPPALVPRAFEAASLPVLRHLARAAGIAGAPTARLAGDVAALAPYLPFRQSYGAEAFGADFLANYGWTELFGPRGLLACDAVSGGFLLLGPHTHYPGHSHAAEELYLPLTSGTLWAAGATAFAPREAGALVHHASGVTHAMKTRDEPLLAAYMWLGGDLRQTPAH